MGTRRRERAVSRDKAGGEGAVGGAAAPPRECAEVEVLADNRVTMMDVGATQYDSRREADSLAGEDILCGARPVGDGPGGVTTPV